MEVDTTFLEPIKMALQDSDIEEAQAIFNKEKKSCFPFYRAELEVLLYEGGNLLLDAYLNKQDFANAYEIRNLQCEKLIYEDTMRQEMYYENGQKILTAMDNAKTLKQSDFRLMFFLQSQLRR